ncbi:class I SAM-dependent methyltransferase [Burkholderia sp. MR1-5-21]
MNHTQPANTEQAAHWNGPSGRAWVDTQAALDRMFQPFEDRLVETVAATPARHVLDVGCGTGTVTVAIARRLGANGRCTGIDVSAPMLDAARSRADREGVRADFIRADAQTHAFASAQFDLIVSRLGVMFFDDPVRAFSNLRDAAADGARLSAIAWRAAAENPFMTTAERAAAPLLNLPPRVPGAPGQFGFGDRDRVASILAASGWTDVDIRPIDVPCVLPTHALTDYVSRLGPVGHALREVDDATRVRVVETALVAFERYVYGDEVRFDAACWVIDARR